MIMREAPDVSVVMSVFGHIEDALTTVKSVLLQSHPNFELILVDDGNSDEDRQTLVDKLQDRRIKIIHNEANVGLTKSLVRGCAAARGRFIARIDSGDLMVPATRLEIQATILSQRPELVIVSGSIEYADFLNRVRYQSRVAALSHDQIVAQPVGKSWFRHVAVMFRRSAYLECGGYNPDYYYSQDTELWPRLLSCGEGVVLPEVFAIASMRSHSISVRNNNIQILAKIRRVLSRYDRIKLSSEFLSDMRFVVIQVVKLLIPIRARVFLRYVKSGRVVGRLPVSSTESLDALFCYYQQAGRF